MRRLARVTSFVGFACVVGGLLLWSAPAASQHVVDASGNVVGSLADGTTVDGGGTPVVQPLPGQPSLADLVLRASQCAVGKDGTHTFFFELEFRADGRLEGVRLLRPTHHGCIQSVLARARVAPFGGPNRTVRGWLSLR